MASSKMPSQPPAFPFSFRIGLWPIGSYRLVDEDEPSNSVGPHRAGGINFAGYPALEPHQLRPPWQLSRSAAVRVTPCSPCRPR